MLDSGPRLRVRPRLGAAALALLFLAPLVGVGHGSEVVPGEAVGVELVATTPYCGPTTYVRPSGGVYRCTFSDDFNGSSLNTDVWTRSSTAATGFQVGQTCYDPRRTGNVRVRQGALELVTTRSFTFTCKSPSGGFKTQYRSGSVASWGNFSQTYGRWEARIRFGENRPGLHANFWLNPQQKAYGAWPASGEIDIAEWFSTAGRAYPTLHYRGSAYADTGRGCPSLDPTVFHTFALEWTATEMRFLFDGRLCFTRAWTPTSPMAAPAPFDRRFYISLTGAVGGMWNAPTRASRFPSVMKVDHVRVWS